MKRNAGLVAAVMGVLLVTGCQSTETGTGDQPPQNGTAPPTEPTQSAPPRAPDPGTYTGVSRSYARPPQSGINSDPSNPNGAPGSYTGSGNMGR